MEKRRKPSNLHFLISPIQLHSGSTVLPLLETSCISWLIYFRFLPMPEGRKRGGKALKIPYEAPLCFQPLSTSKPACPASTGARAQPLLLWRVVGWPHLILTPALCLGGQSHQRVGVFVWIFLFFFFNLCNQTTNVRKERTDLSQAFYVLGFLKFFLSFLFFFGNYCLCLDLLQNEKLCYFNMKKPSHGI